MKRFCSLLVLIFLVSACGSSGSGAASAGPDYTPANGNLHLLDQRNNGFAIYRSGSPSTQDFQHWCELGISEVTVLAGDADSFEGKFASECPALRVVFNEKQSASTPLSISFLQFFDQWVTQAQDQGNKALFRCDCGCHRAGRLAA
jgi:hypothetical protein